MSRRDVRVNVLVWRPRDPSAPADLSYGWPRVLQVRSTGTPWQLPGVLLRPGEGIMSAAGRAAYALGLELPPVHRALTLDQRPAAAGEPEQLVIIVDGGWTDGDDVHVTDHSTSPCPHDCQHERRWASAENLADEIGTTTALSAALGKTPAFVVSRGGAAP
ncbi:NUDIX hydrolase [Streptomyces youssoufiensis]